MRPAFGAAWNRFREVNVNVETVGKLLGGKVQHNIEAGIFQNARSEEHTSELQSPS